VGEKEVGREDTRGRQMRGEWLTVGKIRVKAQSTKVVPAVVP
jgi:hypothetical protein